MDIKTKGAIMTKDKALNKVKDLVCLGKSAEYFDKVLLIDDVTNLINQIYDDFDSRICKNCKYWKKYVNTSLCNEGTLDFIIETNEDFGCNKFERRINEKI